MVKVALVCDVEGLTFLKQGNPDFNSFDKLKFEANKLISPIKYTEKGFEISTNSLGTQNQLLGGGKYETGIGFAIGLDRLYLLI